MNKIIEAEDILADARNFIECIWMAAANLSREEVGPLQTVADTASKKIDEAIALLDEYRESKDSAGPVPTAAEFRTTNRDDGPRRSIF
jgi:hypothetical protein